MKIELPETVARNDVISRARTLMVAALALLDKADAQHPAALVDHAIALLPEDGLDVAGLDVPDAARRSTH